MAYTNSSLVTYVKRSPNHSGQRKHAIDTITIHCVVGQLTVETLGSIFASTSRQASCNYAIGKDGRIALIVDEKNRSWCTSSNANDQRAITIEVASDTKHPYAVNSAAYGALIKLVADICKRNNIKKLLWEGNKSLIGNVARQNMTVHRWFANKSCPGDYLYNRHGEIASKVNALLGQASKPSSGSGRTPKPSKDDNGKELFRVQVGAYSKKENAENMQKRVVAAGFSTYMVEVDDLYKIQVGAFSSIQNAKAMEIKVEAAGFNAIITTNSGGGVPTATQPSVSPTSKPAKKSAKAVAQDIVRGVGGWGTGATRKQKLEEAGYNYDEVQGYVNAILGDKSSSVSKKSAEQVARDIIKGVGNWGTGATRRKKLTAAGYNYNEVQSIINKLL